MIVLVDNKGFSDGANVVNGGLNKITNSVNEFIQGVTNFFGGLSWVEWAILVIVVVVGIVYWVLKKQYELNSMAYEKKRYRKIKF